MEGLTTDGKLGVGPTVISMELESGRENCSINE